MRGISVLAVFAWSATAHADPSRAWAAARVNLPVRTEIVAAFDVATLANRRVLAPLRNFVSADAAAALRRCKLDPATAVEAIVIASSGDDGAAYLALGSVDRAKLAACPAAVASALGLGNHPIAITQRGDIMDIESGSQHSYVGWLTDTIAVLPFDKSSPAALARWV